MYLIVKLRYNINFEYLKIILYKHFLIKIEVKNEKVNIKLDLKYLIFLKIYNQILYIFIFISILNGRQLK